MSLPIAAFQFAPYVSDPSNILSGLSTTNGGTIITIPAGRIWQGTIVLSASTLVAIAGTSLSASGRVSTAGSGVTPPAGDYVRLDIGAPASAVGLAGTGSNGSVTAPMLVAAPAGNSVNLVLNTTNTTTQSASAVGVLM